MGKAISLGGFVRVRMKGNIINILDIIHINIPKMTIIGILSLYLLLL